MMQESIKQSQQWFMACLPYAPGMAAALALHVRNMPDYEKQLHVLYLANDILLKRCAAGSIYCHDKSLRLIQSVMICMAHCICSSLRTAFAQLII